MNNFIAKKIPVPELSVLFIALLVLSGLLPLEKEWLMSTASAITFILAAAAKLIFQFSDNNKKLLLPVRVLAICILLVGLVRISAIIFGFNSLGSLLDMPLVTALGFIFIATALYLLTLHNAEKILLPHLLSMGILFLAMLSVIAYVFRENLLYGTGVYKPMRMFSALCFSLLAISILLVNKYNGILDDLTSKYQGGRIARILIPVAVITPILLGIFQLRSAQTGHYTRPYDLALLTLGRIIILVIFIWRVAVIINRSNKKLIAEIEERKKNEERLQYRKALLEAQNEAIPDAMLVVDTEGKILSYNHHFGELWGIPENILKEQDDTAALQYATTQLVNPTEYIGRVNYIYAHPEEPAHDEIFFKDGRIIERYGNVVMADDGKRYGWAWYFRDITQNKNYEKKIKDFNKELEEKVKARTGELNQSEKRFRSLLENAHDLISLSDGKGKLFYVSPSVEKITGHKIEETINQSVFAFVHPDDIEYAENIRQEFAKRPGESIFISFRYRHKNETYIWLEGTVINLLGDENVKAVVGNFHDVTERKISEETLRKSEKRFRSLIDNAHDIISLSDENGMRFYVSPAIER
ncbi:MAG TPA: PAS domain S-box protein, partial [Chitinophagaceae bacterium]|nr:PAS domain S-box protein [Chitinophagaceae bacterium]